MTLRAAVTATGGAFLGTLAVAFLRPGLLAATAATVLVVGLAAGLLGAWALDGYARRRTPAGADHGDEDPPTSRAHAHEADGVTSVLTATQHTIVGGTTTDRPPTAVTPDPADPPPQSTAVHIWNGWSRGQPTDRARPASPPRADSMRPPDINAHDRPRRVVQCPRCTSFRVNVKQRAVGPAFTCAACKHRWAWCPGDPWPPVTAGLPDPPDPPVDDPT